MTHRGLIRNDKSPFRADGRFPEKRVSETSTELAENETLRELRESGSFG
jgi:hypothetical protein